MHRQDIVHCDLKPENVCIASASRRKFKIIDVGSAVLGHDVHFSCVPDAPHVHVHIHVHAGARRPLVVRARRAALVATRLLRTPPFPAPFPAPFPCIAVAGTCKRAATARPK